MSSEQWAVSSGQIEPLPGDLTQPGVPNPRITNEMNDEPRRGDLTQPGVPNPRITNEMNDEPRRGGSTT